MAIRVRLQVHAFLFNWHTRTDAAVETAEPPVKWRSFVSHTSCHGMQWKRNPIKEIVRGTRHRHHLIAGPLSYVFTAEYWHLMLVRNIRSIRKPWKITERHREWLQLLLLEHTTPALHECSKLPAAISSMRLYQLDVTTGQHLHSLSQSLGLRQPLSGSLTNLFALFHRALVAFTTPAPSA